MAFGKLTHPVSNEAMKSRFFSFVRSDRNLYFLESAKPLQFQKIPFIVRNFVYELYYYYLIIIFLFLFGLGFCDMGDLKQTGSQPPSPSTSAASAQIKFSAS